MTARVRLIGRTMRSLSGRQVAALPKTVDPIYNSAEHRKWRDEVVARAGGRCEAIEDGTRCERAEPKHRMFADHVHEVRDGGARLDPGNGMCLCGSHHAAKTAQHRAARRGPTKVRP